VMASSAPSGERLPRGASAPAAVKIESDTLAAGGSSPMPGLGPSVRRHRSKRDRLKMEPIAQPNRQGEMAAELNSMSRLMVSPLSSLFIRGAKGGSHAVKD
jgi:hypothetical protein